MLKSFINCLLLLNFGNCLSQDSLPKVNNTPQRITYYNGKYNIAGKEYDDFQLKVIISKDITAYRHYKTSRLYMNISTPFALITVGSLVFTTIKLIQGKNAFPLISSAIIASIPLNILYYKSRKRFSQSIEIYNSHQQHLRR